jgi:hypothetical protein
MKKKDKAPKGKRAAMKDLTPKDTRQVKGGRKAGKGQQEFLVIKMSDVLVT